MIIKVNIEKCVCDVCGFSWIPRNGMPKVCGGVTCHSYKWNNSGKVHDLTCVEDGFVEDVKDMEQLEKNYGITVNEVYKNGK